MKELIREALRNSEPTTSIGLNGILHSGLFGYVAISLGKIPEGMVLEATAIGITIGVANNIVGELKELKVKANK